MTVMANAEALKIWESSSTELNQHLYLEKKNIPLIGARINKEWIIVPVYESEGVLQSLQKIGADGRKLNLPGCSMAGGWHAIGDDEEGPLLFAEGWGTAVSIHSATGSRVVVTFGSENLGAVALQFRERYPTREFILCADDDADKEKNTGLESATCAATAIGAKVAVPLFEGARPRGASDFNDLQQHSGLEAVRKSIDAAEFAPKAGATPEASLDDVTGVTSVTASDDGTSSVTSDATAGVTRVTVTASECPCFKVFDESVFDTGSKRTLAPGVWHFQVSGRSGNTTVDATRVCTPLHVTAVTCDPQGKNYGRMLRFRTTSGDWRQWAMPMEMLSGSGEAMRAELLSMGVEIDPYQHKLLTHYLTSTRADREVRCVLQTGWCGDSFVLPDITIGPGANDLIFQCESSTPSEFQIAGSLEGWIEAVGRFAIGNPLLMVGISAAFAGPLIEVCHAESGGIHIYGTSSTGKTTIIQACCSVWGSPTFMRSWRATANGLEGAAMMANDTMLALDEIRECDPRQVGEIIYALGNGRGKQRATRSGGAKAVGRFKVAVISTGERSIPTILEEAGVRTQGGHLVRILDVPATRAQGAWDDLHGFASGDLLSNALKSGVKEQYGHPGLEFLRRLTADERDLYSRYKAIREFPELAVPGDDGQATRGAERFALFALAGELATEFGITGWSPGAAIHAAGVLFRIWLAAKGNGSAESIQIFEQLMRFIERNGEGRFRDPDNDQRGSIRDLAGYCVGADSDSPIYYFNADGMREALQGFDFSPALTILESAGVLRRANEKERAFVKRFGGTPYRYYEVHAGPLGALLSHSDGFQCNAVTPDHTAPVTVQSAGHLAVTDVTSETPAQNRPIVKCRDCQHHIPPQNPIPNRSQPGGCTRNLTSPESWPQRHPTTGDYCDGYEEAQ